ncbi:MAG: hypothetical protein ACTSVA_08455 [Candidatus Njordarchaeales archaeon]
MASDEEELLETLLSKHLETALQIYARQIAEDVRSELLAKENVLLRNIDAALITMLSRKLLYAMINSIKEAIENSLRRRIHVIESKLREIIRDELRKMARESITKSAIARQRTPSLKKEEEELLKELRECRVKLSNLSDRLGKFFNLVIKFEPRFHALPLIEQAGEMDIDELARMLRMPRDKILEFLKITSAAGITYMKGNKVFLVTPIFKIKKSKS